MQSKICRKCGIKKEITNFHKQKSCKDGHISICRDCKSEYDKKYQVEYWKTDTYKTRRLRNIYGITPQNYNLLLII